MAVGGDSGGYDHREGGIQLSVIMPVFNAYHYLVQSIESVLTQDFQGFEFIIIENGSTDRSRDLIESVKDPRLRVIVNHVNIGPPRALNQGLQIARGTYVARMDADDISLPGRLSSQVEFLERNPQCAVLGTQARAIDESGKEISRLWYPITATGIYWKLMFTSPVAHSSVMMRRRIILDIGGYDDAYRHAADHKLWSSVISQGYQVANLKDSFMCIRIHGDSDGSGLGRSDITEEVVSIGYENFRSIVNKTVSKSDIRAMVQLLRHCDECPVNLVSIALGTMHEIRNRLGGEARLYYGATLLRVALTVRSIVLRLRLKLFVQGVWSILSCKNGQERSRFIKEWLLGSSGVRKVLMIWSRSA